MAVTDHGFREWLEKHKRAFEAVAACCSYAFCSISLSLFNKLVFSGIDFNYPVSICAFQSCFAVVFLQLGDCLKLSQPVPLSKKLFLVMLPVSLLFCLMLWTGGKALREVSMPVFTVFKNLCVPGISLWEWCRHGQRFSRGILASMALMVVGSTFAAAGDLTATLRGIAWLHVNTAITIAYMASLKEIIPPDINSAAKAMHNNILTLIIFLGTSASTGELWDFARALRRQETGFQLALVVTGVLGTAINVSTFWLMRVAAGSTYAFVGASNKVPIALIGHFAFHSALTVYGWVGVAFGLASGFLYAYCKDLQRRRELETSTDEKSQLMEEATGLAETDDHDVETTAVPVHQDGAAGVTQAAAPGSANQDA